MSRERDDYGGDPQVATVDDLDRVLERWHLAQDEFVKGNPEPVKKMWSHGQDVSVANPYGPPV